MPTCCQSRVLRKKSRDGIEWAMQSVAGDAWKEPIDVSRTSHPCRAAAARRQHDLGYGKCFVADNERVHDFD